MIYGSLQIIELRPYFIDLLDWKKILGIDTSDQKPFFLIKFDVALKKL